MNEKSLKMKNEILHIIRDEISNHTKPMTQIARDTQISRSIIFRYFQDETNPQMTNLITLVNYLDLQMIFDQNFYVTNYQEMIYYLKIRRKYLQIYQHELQCTLSLSTIRRGEEGKQVINLNHFLQWLQALNSNVEIQKKR